MQMQDWTEQQKQERAQKKQEEKNEDNMYYNYMTQVDALRQQMEKKAS